MKYQRTESFRGDYGRLSEDERKLFRKALTDFIAAAERKAADPAAKWPKTLRVKDVEGAPGIWEMTWSFSGPDGPATWEWVEVDGDPAIRWRRVGNHSIFRDP